MPPSVDHYGATYSQFADQVYAAVHAEAFGEDIGQTGWLTRDEQDLFVSWLQLGSGRADRTDRRTKQTLFSRPPDLPVPPFSPHIPLTPKSTIGARRIAGGT